MSDDPGSVASSVSDQLRAAIVATGLTAYSLGKSAGVDAGMIQRFLNGERGLNLAAVDRLAAALGLRLVRASDDAPADPDRGVGAGGNSGRDGSAPGGR